MSLAEARNGAEDLAEWTVVDARNASRDELIDWLEARKHPAYEREYTGVLRAKVLGILHLRTLRKAKAS